MSVFANVFGGNVDPTGNGSLFGADSIYKVASAPGKVTAPVAASAEQATSKNHKQLKDKRKAPPEQQEATQPRSRKRAKSSPVLVQAAGVDEPAAQDSPHKIKHRRAVGCCKHKASGPANRTPLHTFLSDKPAVRAPQTKDCSVFDRTKLKNQSAWPGRFLLATWCQRRNASG